MTDTNKFPQRGTILIFGAKPNDSQIIIPWSFTQTVNWVQDRIEKNQGWMGEITRRILGAVPTLPVPDGVKPIDIPIVKVDTNNREVRWTLDGWETFSIRRMNLVVGINYDNQRPGSRTWSCWDDISEEPKKGAPSPVTRSDHTQICDAGIGS